MGQGYERDGVIYDDYGNPVVGVPAGYQVPQYQAQVYQQPAPAPTWRCPFCGYVGEPAFKSKVSTGGWVVFVLLLLFCFPLCWVGLLIKTESDYCPSCRVQLNTG